MQAAAWTLALVSLQTQRQKAFRLPLYLKLPLLPVLGVEALLRHLANRMAAEDLAKSNAAGGADGRRGRGGGGGGGGGAPGMKRGGGRASD